MNKKYFILSLVFCLGTFSGFAQTDDVDVSYYQSEQTPEYKKKNLTEKDNSLSLLQKISVGGNLGLQVGTYTYIEVSPDVAYHFNKWICLGVGGTYIFSHYSDNFFSENYHVGGARGFVEGHFFNYLALRAEYQWLNYELYAGTSLLDKKRVNSNNLLLGAGYYQRMGRGAIYLQLFYNISDKKPSENILNEFVVKAGFAIFLK